MPVKVIIIKDKPIAQIVLKKDITTIGRKSDCDISIKDPAVSGNHAHVQKMGSNYVIQDLGSTNGLHLGGKRIKQHKLKNKDVIVIGEHQLRFIISDSLDETIQTKVQAALKPNQTRVPIVTSPDVTRVPPAVAPEPARVAGSASMKVVGFLKVISGKDAGNKIKLTEGLTTIGQPGIQIAAVSKRPQGHFIIHVDGGKDKDRVPMVNGEPTGFKSRKLESGDKIEVAGIRMEYLTE